MLIMMTSTVAISIHATSPLFGVGAGVAAGAGAAAAGTATGAVAAGFSALSAAYAGMPTAANANNNASMEISFLMGPLLKRFGAGLAGAYAYDLFELEHENLAVADLAGIGGLLDRLDHLLEHVAA